MHAGLLASDGCFSSALTARIDVLSTAPAQRPGAGPSIPPIRVDVTGTGRTVTTGAGRTVPVTRHPRDRPAPGVVVAPALATMTAADTLSALAARHPGDHQGRRHITGEDYPQRRRWLVPLMSGFATPLIGMTGADKQIHRIGDHRGSLPSRRTGSADRRVRAATTGSTPWARVTRRAFPAFPPHRGTYVHAFPRRSRPDPPQAGTCSLPDAADRPRLGRARFGRRFQDHCARLTDRCQNVASEPGQSQKLTSAWAAMPPDRCSYGLSRHEVTFLGFMLLG
jgi:hypothetical protein